MDIPDREHFFMILNREGLFALASRRNDLAHTMRTLMLDAIKPIHQTKTGTIGGLENIGNFKEGYCFKCMTVPGAVWIMCADSLDVKNTWMNAIREAK